MSNAPDDYGMGIIARDGRLEVLHRAPDGRWLRLSVRLLVASTDDTIDTYRVSVHDADTGAALAQEDVDGCHNALRALWHLDRQVRSDMQREMARIRRATRDRPGA